MLYEFLGFVNLILLGILVTPYVLRKLNGWFFHTKSPAYFKVLKAFKAIHRPLALALLVVVVIHGWLALGSLTLHTGTVAAAVFILTAVLGLSFYLLKKPNLLKTHRVFALLAVLLVAFHLLFPWALS